jgi:hypothetical protein
LRSDCIGSVALAWFVAAISESPGDSTWLEIAPATSGRPAYSGRPSSAAVPHMNPHMRRFLESRERASSMMIFIGFIYIVENKEFI